MTYWLNQELVGQLFGLQLLRAGNTTVLIGFTRPSQRHSSECAGRNSLRQANVVSQMVQHPL